MAEEAQSQQSWAMEHPWCSYSNKHQRITVYDCVAANDKKFTMINKFDHSDEKVVSANALHRTVWPALEDGTHYWVAQWQRKISKAGDILPKKGQPGWEGEVATEPFMPKQEFFLVEDGGKFYLLTSIALSILSYIVEHPECTFQEVSDGVGIPINALYPYTDQFVTDYLVRKAPNRSPPGQREEARLIASPTAIRHSTKVIQ